ncbi:MAG TPA: SAM-dependent methyltransferase, partial [Phycisphaerae bacterium]|nr:SAM-dependent methyltransferase [Phycisphaerae bacterium]
MIEHCPNCGAGGLRIFYETPGIPVHSCMMLADEQAAREFPKGDLALGFCSACGFVTNARFDGSLQHYATGYEEQQSFSPRFRRFQTELIDTLIERYDVRGRNVVEIGCGKGDFLIELCTRGRNHGVGIDPACDPS